MGAHLFDYQGANWKGYRCRYCGTLRLSSSMEGWPSVHSYFARDGQQIEKDTMWSLDVEARISCETDPALRRNADAEVALDKLEAIAFGGA
jgi:hypothetical protein